MRAHAVRWMAVLSCAAAVAGCGERSRSATARSAAGVPGSGPARMVADVRPGVAPAGSSPHGFLVSGTTAYFAADDGSSGFELWKTQGLPGDATLVADLRPGGGSSLPPTSRVEGVAFGGGILFGADDGSRGTELWFSDGTGGGTRLVKDIEPGTASSSPRRFAVAGGKAFFVADTAAAGAELWVTDGTEGGTEIVADIEPFTVGSEPTELTAVGTTLFFAARDARGLELWKTDASTPGLPTSIVRDLATGDASPSSLVAFQGKLYFVATDATTGNRVLWSSDGTELRTAPLGDVALAPANPERLTPVGNVLYFVGGTPREVWAWDATALQYSKKTLLGATASAPTGLASNGSALFAALTGGPAAKGRELYAWNGFVWTLLADIAPGPLDSDPVSLTNVGGTLYFGATSAGAAAVWRSDGTPGGTWRIEPGLSVGEIAALGGRAILSGDDTLRGPEPWAVEPGATGAAQLGNLHPDVSSSLPERLTAWNGKLHFTADDGIFGRELWSADPVTTTAALVTDDLQIGLTSSQPGDLLDAGAFLLFAGNGLFEGRELWRWDGVDPVTLVTDLRPDAASALLAPAWLTQLGGATLFVADDGGGLGRELWRTNGTAAGTFLVKDVFPGAPSSSPTGLTAIGGNVWFVADDGDAGNPFPKAYRSDGTGAGTVPVAFAAGDVVYDPAWFVDFAGSTAMSAVHPAFGRTLFVWDPAQPAILRVVNPFDQLSASDPVGFVAHAGAGWFAARDTTSHGYALWRTDGFSAGTSRVASIATLPGGGRFASPVSLAGKLWFVGNDDVHGDELWTSDGTEAGTRMLADVLPGAGGSADGSVLVPLASRGHVLYAASDGLSGRELWISDGTVLGTRLLQDIWPGARSSNPAAFTRLGDLVYFTADDGSSGRELWVIDTSPAALDLTPPVPFCPAQAVTVEATRPAGADPVYVISATDDRGGPVTLTFSPASGAPIPFGITPVLATAADETGNRAQCSYDVLVQDTTAPALTCPATVSLEATSAAGAVGTFTGATAAVATDVVTVPPVIVYAPASGSTFPLGAGKSPRTTPVSVTARDASFNTSACSFDVIVSDTTPPAVGCPAAVVVEATGSTGATATWGAATVTDAVSAASSIVVSFDAAQAVSVFPLGTSTVTARARDEAGNVGSCGFGVQVRDTIAPALSCPASFSVEATRFTGADATFAATATDAVSVAPTVTYDVVPGPRASGAPVTTAFPYGTTPVSATAFDGFNTSAPCVFSVQVVDTIPPVATCPPSAVDFEATSASGAIVVLAGQASATDVATQTPGVAYVISGAGVPATGTPLPLGATSVDAVATDRGGNTHTCSFAVRVVDTTGPALVQGCDFDRLYEALGPAGATVTNPVGFASDLVTAPGALTYRYLVSGTATPYPGGVQPIGTVAVDAFAVDAAGNQSAPCTYRSIVQDTLPPFSTCPPDFTLEATGPGGATAIGWADATGNDLVTPASSITAANGLVTYDPPLGSLLPLGVTTITATVRDAALNPSTCTFRVSVVDTTGPVATCPAVPPIEATGPLGATPTFAASAVDAVTSIASITYDRQPGDPFPLGTTTVTATARDGFGNAGTCQLQMVVRDTTPPSHAGACGFDVFFEAADASGGVVQNPVGFATDLVTSVAGLGYQYFLEGTSTPHQGGVVHPLGITSVDAFAIDAAGNVGTACTFRSIVRDSTPPVPACPAAVVVEAASPAGATVSSWASATGTDAVTPAGLLTEEAGRVTYLPPRGNLFPLGDSTVTATVRDEASNGATCTFVVHVVDTTAPVPTCPTSVPPAEATGNGAAQVTFAATATDTVTALPIVTYDLQPGDPFPVGTSIVTATATDLSGNDASCQFEIVVVDTTPPSISCPPDRRVEGSGEVPARFPEPAVSDAGTPSTCVFSSASPSCRLASTRQSGDLFPVGTTPVTFTATDASGNSASCTMTVTVAPPPPGGGAGGGAGGGCATGSGGALALLGLAAALLLRRRR